MILYRTTTVETGAIGEDSASTVENEAAVSGMVGLDLVIDGEVRESRTVLLDTHEASTVEFTIRLDEPGAHELRIGDERVTVTGMQATLASTQPGVGASLAVLAVSLRLLSEVRRR